MKNKNKRNERRNELRRHYAALRAREKSHPGKKSTETRDFPHESEGYTRRAVCKRCHCIMQDAEPSSPLGEFYHPSHDKEGKLHWCVNASRLLRINDLELEPFLPKPVRRRYKRLGIRP